MAKSASKKKTRIDARRFAPIERRRDQYLTSSEGKVHLLLLADVPRLGTQGETVAVAIGYARNYLIPHGLAAEATAHNITMLELARAKTKAVEADRLADLKTLAGRVERTSCTVQAKANEEGHLYGSVGPEEIVEQLKQENIDIEAGMIQMETPFKELGVYTVDVRLHEGITAAMKVWVVQE